VIEHVSLRGEGPQAVPEQDEWRIGVFVLGDAAQPNHVLHEQIKSAFAEISEVRGRGRGAAVSTVIVSVDSQVS
jgi:hypothetical protein